jgi:hypothetical protein
MSPPRSAKVVESRPGTRATRRVESLGREPKLVEITLLLAHPAQAGETRKAFVEVLALLSTDSNGHLFFE